MRVKKTFSACRVTMAGADVPAPPPPVNVVCEKLAFTRMFLLRYQFKPADHACAAEADVAGLANTGKAALSMSNSSKRPTTCNAPHWPLCGSNGCSGVTPLNEALSPVKIQPPVISQAVLCKSASAFV